MNSILTTGRILDSENDYSHIDYDREQMISDATKKKPIALSLLKKFFFLKYNYLINLR